MEVKEFEVEVLEYLSRTVTVKATNEVDALILTKKKYFNEDIILDENDYMTTEFILPSDFCCSSIFFIKW